MASMYSAKVMEHFANPHNVGEIPDANGVGEVGNPKCGDIMRMYLKIENNVIDRKSTRLNSSHKTESRMPSSA